MAHTNLAEIALARGEYAMARQQLQRAVPYSRAHIRRERCFLSTLAGWLATTPRANDAVAPPDESSG